MHLAGASHFVASGRDSHLSPADTDNAAAKVHPATKEVRENESSDRSVRKSEK